MSHLPYYKYSLPRDPANTYPDLPNPEYIPPFPLIPGYLPTPESPRPSTPQPRAQSLPVSPLIPLDANESEIPIDPRLLSMSAPPRTSYLPDSSHLDYLLDNYGFGDLSQRGNFGEEALREEFERFENSHVFNGPARRPQMQPFFGGLGSGYILPGGIIPGAPRLHTATSAPVSANGPENTRDRTDLVVQPTNTPSASSDFTSPFVTTPPHTTIAQPTANIPAAATTPSAAVPEATNTTLPAPTMPSQRVTRSMTAASSQKRSSPMSNDSRGTIDAASRESSPRSASPTQDEVAALRGKDLLNYKDQKLRELRQAGKTYAEIVNLLAQKGISTSESTLRGRWRVLTKPRAVRPRQVVWTDNHDLALIHSVNQQAAGPPASESNQEKFLKIKWKNVSTDISNNAGFSFGYSTCKKRFILLRSRAVNGVVTIGNSQVRINIA